MLKQCRHESELKVVTKNKEIANIESTHFLGVIIDSNLG
jgi:hypothetical protein